ncbi:MAG: phage holin family protein [Clostridia bacterium]|nr:phage holin family protein [Clostridia bacterium]
MENARTIWGTICTVAGAVGGMLAQAFGGWDNAMIALLIFMAIDYITGLIVAGVFHASPKSDNGALESKAGWKGLARKGGTLLIVLVAAELDLVMGTTVVRDGVIIGFLLNELVSIVENAGLMGIPMPAAITNAIELLKKKEGKKDETESG